MMLRTVVAALFITSVSTSAFAAPRPHPAPIDARQHRQAVRVAQGVERREISPAERRAIATQEAAIRAEERRYRRSGGGLTPAERRDLERDLDRAGRHIFHATHN